MTWLLLLTHPAALLVLWRHPYWWVRRDVARIAADGAGQTLTRAFHAGRTWWRAGFVGSVAALASLPLILSGVTPYLVSTAALATIGAAWFAYYFTPALNVARDQPYIGRYHVSWAVGASWLDRTIWGRAWRRGGHSGPPPDYPEPVTVALAATELRRVLTAALVAGVVAYGAGVLYLLRNGSC